MFTRAKLLVRQSAIYGLGNVLSQAISFFLLPLYTQYFTTADYGTLTAANTFTSIVNIILQFGLQGAATRFYYDYLDDERERRAYYCTIWVFLTLTALLLALVIDWQGDALFRLLFPGVSYKLYGRLSLWFSFVSVASVLPLVLFRVREQASSYVMFTVLRFLLTTVAIIFCVVVLRQGVRGSLIGQLLIGTLFVVPFTIVMLRNVRPAFHWDKLKASLSFGLPIIPHQLSGWALSVSDRILLAHFVSLDQLGIYSLGYRFGTIMDMIVQSVNMAWAPLFYRTAATEKDAPKTFARLATYFTLFLLLLGLGVALLARDVITLIAKPEFLPAYRIVPVVVVAFIAHGFYFLAVNPLFFVKETKRLPLYTGVSASMNIGLNLLTIPRFGIMAAAWNTTIGYVLLTILVFRESNTRYPIPYEYRRLGILLGAACAVFALGWYVDPGNPYLGLAVRLLLIGLFPGALLLFRFFTPGEISGMQLLLKRGMQRLRVH